MNFDQLALAAASREALKSLATLHQRIATGDIDLDIPSAAECVPDSAWDKAIEAARKELLKGVEREFLQQAKALAEAGVEDVPTLSELKSH